jgi:hypothetical protein
MRTGPVLLLVAVAACSSSSSSSGSHPDGGPEVDGSSGSSSGGGASSGSGAGSGSSSGGSGSSSSSGGSSGSSSGGKGSSSSSSSSSSGGRDGGGPAGVEVPGPSQALFGSPYYACSRNFYVAPGGNDSSDGMTQATAWKTIQHADSSSRTGGDCINVAPGTYSEGAVIAHGGTTASSTGYVVYRCQTLDGCTITESDHGFEIAQATNVTNYVMFDGFELAASSPVTYGIGVNVAAPGGNSAGLFESHHVWVINSKIHGYGQSGMQMNDGEYLYAIHNLLFDNSRVTCDAQGSGISYVELKAIPNGYTPTADDTNNPAMGLYGPGFPFHNVISWNVTYNNGLTQCGSASSAYDTDGNGIIMDTFNGSGELNVVYPSQTLIAFNVSYANGGGGVHVFNSEFVTVANNSCYNNYLDPYNNGSARACIDSSGSYGNTFINNIAVAVPASHGTCAYTTVPYAMWNNAFIGSPPSASDTADVFANNVSIIDSSSCQGEVLTNNGDNYSCSTNKCATDPKWVDVGTTSTGTETTPPVGVNFALGSGSPAIGAGQTPGYLSPQAADIGACDHGLTTCP